MMVQNRVDKGGLFDFALINNTLHLYKGT